MKPPYESIPRELNEFFEVCRDDDARIDEHIDRLLASVPGDRLAAGIVDVLAAGMPVDWPSALQLVGILANESPELWSALIQAIESREDLEIPALMEGIALLRQADRLPATGRCSDLAEEWAEATAGDNAEVETLIRLVEEDPEDATTWLGEVAEWSVADRNRLIEQLRTHPPGHGRDTLLSWIESIDADGLEAESAESEKTADVPVSLSPSWELAKPDVRPLWITDLTETGTFGVGLETAISSPCVRIVVAGSLLAGLQYANSFEPSDDAFEPRMPEGRNLSFHPVLVRQMIRELVRIGFSGKSVPTRTDSILETLLREISPEQESDAAQWERWTRILVDSNPLDRRPSALFADARETLDGLGYWLVPDTLAKELASEFRFRTDDTEIERVRGVMRVWFERSLGPRMGGLIEALRQMGYFWLSLGELDGRDDPTLWHSRARASARIVADLSDPSRVVATHPFVEQFMLRVFAAAASG